MKIWMSLEGLGKMAMEKYSTGKKPQRKFWHNNECYIKKKKEKKIITHKCAI